MSRRHVMWSIMFASLGSGACQGEMEVTSYVTDESAEVDPGSSQMEPAEAMVPQERADGTLPDVPFSTSVGLRRLTSHEYRRTIMDLTGVPVDPPRELVVAGHTQIAPAQKIGYDDTIRYLDLGVSVAERAAPSLFAESGCSDDQEACTTQWAESLMRRVLRGTPDPETHARYMAMLDDPQAGSTPAERRITWLTALLTSPHFLYRKEVGQQIAGEAHRELTSVEIASRMSYLLWQSAPDNILLDVAEHGDLRDEATRRTQFARMIADDRARFGLRAFVEDWMTVLDPEVVGSKDARILEGTNASLSDDVQTSLGLTIDEHFSQPERGYAGLIAADRFVVNAQLSGVLELEQVQGEGFEPRQLDTSRQRGILTHPAVLAAHSKESGASPFPIGAFVFNNVLCNTIPPPQEVPEFDEDSELDGELTLRERLEGLVQGPQCIGCHTMINPPGFAFLPFDPIGRYKPADSKGRVHDTSGEMLVGGDPLIFDNVSELAAHLAEHPMTARCVADRLFRWTYGRFERSGDEPELAALREVARTRHTDAAAMLEALVTSQAFIHVRPTTDQNEEEEPLP